jgi:hypothetical protein
LKAYNAPEAINFCNEARLLEKQPQAISIIDPFDLNRASSRSQM